MICLYNPSNFPFLESHMICVYKQSILANIPIGNIHQTPAPKQRKPWRSRSMKVVGHLYNESQGLNAHSLQAKLHEVVTTSVRTTVWAGKA
jgi:hypothetical protein